MSEILITGGTGTLGMEIVRQLLTKKCQVTILSTKNNPELPIGVRTLKADLTDKNSLDNVFKDYQIIIHCASNPLDSENVDIKGTMNLLQSINHKVSPHIVYISIVGIDKSSHTYYHNKYEVEKMIEKSRFPWTIIRITQFHDFVLHRIINSLDNDVDSTFKVPKKMTFQSIATKDAAEIISDVVANDPKYSIITLGGPEVLDIKEMVKAYLDAASRSDKIEESVTDNSFYKIFTTGINLCPEKSVGNIKWKDYIINYLRNKNNKHNR